MSHSYPGDLSLGYGLVALCQMTRARSAWLQKGKALIDSNLHYAESRIEQMAEIVDEMTTSYAEVGRQMESAFFGFGEHFLLAVCERSMRVVLYFRADYDEPLAEVISAARRFLRKNRDLIDSSLEETQPVFIHAIQSRRTEPEPTPVPTEQNPWPSFEKRLRALLSQYIHEGQAHNLVLRAMRDRGVAGDPKPSQVGEIARAAVKNVAQPDKRALLLKELEALLGDYHLS